MERESWNAGGVAKILPDTGRPELKKELGLVELTNKARHNLVDLTNLIKVTFRRIENVPDKEPPREILPCPLNPLDDMQNQLNAMNNLINEMRDFFNKEVAYKL